MRRFGVIVALGALLGMFAVVLTASPALAGRGHKWELVQTGPFTVDKSFCGFTIGVTFPGISKEYIKVLKAPDGPDGTEIVLLTGAIKVTYTNLSTGKAISLIEAGPGKVLNHADGSATAAIKGINGPIIFSPADAQRFGLPTVSVTAGALTTSFAADGTITSVTLHGHVRLDLCTALS